MTATVATANSAPTRTRLAAKALMVCLLALGLSSVFQLFWNGPTHAQAPDACLANLPVPTPAAPSHRVVQLVNCSNEKLLGTATAAHQVGKPPTPVLPREGTWVMRRYGSPNNENILTIDIPPAWEATIGAGSVGPNFWARTGCRYDIANGIAQCETGGCSGIYDCSKALKGPPPGATLAEWTFYEKVGHSLPVFLDHPDISAVNGVNLNVDIQPVGGSTTNPLNAKDPQWLAQNYPLTVHGADLRTQGPGLGQCRLAFLLRRSELTGFTSPPGQALFAFVIVTNTGLPLGGEGLVACFSNCGRYEFPTVPAPDCNDSDANCHLWKTFCLNAPAAAYGKPCSTDKDCFYNGIDYGIACWNNGSRQTCEGRGFIKNASCDPSVCTFPYGYLGSTAWQPPYGHCTDVTPVKNACVGDDTVHRVMRKAYTWPNDPQVYGGDAPLYRIIFAPGGTTVPITPSVGQIPLCSSLPTIYGYANVYSASVPTECDKPCDGPVKLCAGVQPPAATFAVAYPGATAAQPWACNFKPGGGGGNNGVICRWK
ncbi:MAG: thaumatin family protein [Methylocella sp.]